MVSDAFFPFRDGVDVGLREGVTAVIQPGGSDRDFEIIEACNEAKRGHGLHRPALLQALILNGLADPRLPDCPVRAPTLGKKKSRGKSRGSFCPPSRLSS